MTNDRTAPECGSYDVVMSSVPVPDGGDRHYDYMNKCNDCVERWW